MMKRTASLIAVLLLAACASTSGSSSMPTTDPDSIVRQAAERFETAARAGDVARVTAFYADDAQVLPPNAPVLRGTEGARTFWGMMLAAGPSDIDLITEDVLSSGDLLVETGRYEVTKPFGDSGKYIVVWAKRGGEWKIVRDIFNTSRPAN
jgi:ketosteroid isomerase-like protein